MKQITIFDKNKKRLLRRQAKAIAKAIVENELFTEGGMYAVYVTDDEIGRTIHINKQVYPLGEGKEKMDVSGRLPRCWKNEEE